MSFTAYREWKPLPGQAVARCWWEQNVADSDGPRWQRVLPDACADIMVARDEVIVVGPSANVALSRLDAGAGLRGLRITTEAIGPLFGVPAADLRDMTLPLSQVLGDRQARRVGARIFRGTLPPWFAQASVDARARGAVRQLSTSTADSVETVASSIGISSRHLRRLLIDHTGLGPKAIQRVGRLQRFLRLADAQPIPDLASLAYDAGYVDQSHLSHEVKELTALTPANLLSDRRG
jgi:AraC-like DNA-binding protein